LSSISILPALPMNVAKLMTKRSRIGSIGGLVTWAKNCLK